MGLLLTFISPSFSQRSSITGSRFKLSRKKKGRKPLNYINHLDITGQIGSASALGDLCNGAECIKASPLFGLGLQYRYSESLMFRIDGSYIKLRGSDEGGQYEFRNLSYKSDNAELVATVVYDLLEYNKMYRRRHLISPYLYTGIGLLYYSPKAELNGETHRLRPLQTEGVEYGSMTVVIPYGFGLRFKASPHINVSTEFGWRYTFTDYLDDVSGTYDPSKAQLQDNDISKQLADRRTSLESDRGTYHNGQRGNPDANDYYFMLSLKASYTLKVTKQRYNINSNVSRFRLIKSIKKKK